MTTFAVRALIALSIQLIACQASAGYVFTDISRPGETESRPHAINNADQIVGYFHQPGVGYQSFLWQNNQSTVLLPPIGVQSEAYAINDAGYVAGKSYPAGVSGNRALLWQGAPAVTLAVPGATQSSATGISNANQSSGWAYFANLSAYRAVRWIDSSPTILGTLGGSSSFGISINDSGTVVGYSNTTINSIVHAALWNSATAIELETPASYRSSAESINNQGQVVGWIDPPGFDGFRAATWINNALTLLDTLGGNESFAWDVNNGGSIVGQSRTGSGQQRATLWDGDAIVDLNTFLDEETISAGWVLTSAWSINDKGWIVGEARNINLGSRGHAYLLSVQSIPEPSTLTLFFASFGVLVVLGRFRHQRAIH